MDYLTKMYFIAHRREQPLQFFQSFIEELKGLPSTHKSLITKIYQNPNQMIGFFVTNVQTNDTQEKHAGGKIYSKLGTANWLRLPLESSVLGTETSVGRR